MSHFDYIICTTSLTQKYVKTALESILSGFFFFSISLFCSTIDGGREIQRRDPRIISHIMLHVALCNGIVHHCSRYLEKQIIESRHIPSYVVHCGSPWGAPFWSRLFLLFFFSRGESATVADTSCYSNSWLDSGCTIKRAEHLNQITRAFAG